MLFRHARFERAQYRACIQWFRVAGADLDQLAQRSRHGFERLDFALEPQLLFDRDPVNVIAACLVLAFDFEQFAYLRQRESALLRLPDEVETAYRFLGIEPVAGRA